MKILIVAAHTDDEVLGCGGVIAKHVAEGDIVDVIYMADGVSSRGQGGEQAFASRQVAAKKAQKILGIQKAYYLDFADNKMDSVALLDIIQPLEDLVQQLTPEVVYTHHHGDLNLDHRMTHQALLTACRPQPGSSVRAIYTFEVLSSTEWALPGKDNVFSPCRFVDISGFLETKLRALTCYKDEMRPFPHARSFEMVESNARLRGGSVGFSAAEAFEVVRECVC